MKFYRFQGRETLDTHSYCEFLVDIWFELGGQDKELNWDDWSFDDQADLLEVLGEKWGFIADIWIEQHEEALTPILPKLSDDALETVIYLVDYYSDLQELFQLQHKFPLPGVFAIEDKGQCLEDLFNRSLSPDLGMSNNYLLTLTAEDWVDLGEYGYLLFDATCLGVQAVPAQYIKTSVD